MTVHTETINDRCGVEEFENGRRLILNSPASGRMLVGAILYQITATLKKIGHSSIDDRLV